MKKISSILLLTVLMLSMFSVSVFAAGTPCAASQLNTVMNDGTSTFVCIKVATGALEWTKVTGPPDDTDGAINVLYNKVIGFAKALAAFTGAIATMVIVYGGIMYVTSQGDSKKTEQGKLAIISAAIGFGIALMALVIAASIRSLIGN